MKRSNNIAFATSLFLAACGGEDPANNAPDTNNDTTTQMLELSSADLPELGDGFVYEGWIIVDDAPVSTGRFVADEGGGVSLDFEVERLDDATKFVLTIEPEPEDDAGPSAVKLLGGDLVDGQTVATISDGAALGTDFGDAAGSYILAAPSAEMGTAGYNNGIWFLDPDAGPASSLDLPELPEGWVYEGWVVTDDGPVTTGRFSALDAPDSDGAGPDAGPNDTPPFPGQDFVEGDGLIDIVGKTVVISVEPEPDDSPAPFTLKPLIDANAEDVGEKVLQSFENMATAPTLDVGTK